MTHILDIIKNSAKKFPNKTAIIFENKKLTYLELYDEIINFSNSLRCVPKGSVISMYFQNSIDFVITYFGILNSSCIAHIVPYSISEPNFINQINSSNPYLILTSKNNFDYLSQFKINKNIEIFNEIKETSTSDLTNQNYFDDFAYLIYTSGTTSIPKGVGVTHSNVLFTTKNIVNILKYSPSDIDILPLPLYHSFGLGCMHTSFFVGSTLILHQNASNLEELFVSINKHKATTLSSVPSTLTKILEYFSNEEIEKKMENLRLIITNSTSISENTVKRYEQILKNGNLATYYGLTEASRSTFMIFDKQNKEKSVGIPAPHVNIKLINEKGCEDKIGTIWINGPNVIKKYWNDSSDGKNIVNDWLNTGDIGSLDSDGYLYINGRLDDMINVSGEKVFPEEIETVVLQIKGIKEAAAVGMDHKIFGQVVKLFVNKVEDSHITKSEIMSYCIRNLERYKVPLKIEFVESLPRTDYGKIQRSKLRSEKFGF